MSDADVLRVIDAAANRAAEALRVVEDHARFVLDDAYLTGCCKQLRHDLTTALEPIPSAARAACRQTQRDVGADLTTAAEQHRADLGAVLSANLARLQQALRSLEEYGKLFETPSDGEQRRESVGAALEKLRYRSYTLAAALEIGRASRQRLATVRLMVLVDGCNTPAAFEKTVRDLFAGQVDAIQLRDKKLSDRDLLARARTLSAVARELGQFSIVNDRPDLAAAARADGVQLGQDDLPVKEARAIVGSELLIGVSTHSIEQARQAVLNGANYLGVGPTYTSQTKPFDAFPGPALLREVAQEIGLPAFAIGGITLENISEVLSCGLHRIAISHAITAAANPAAAAIQYKNALHN